VKRAGGWLLGLVAIGAMGAGGWWALRPAFNRETVGVLFVESGRGPGPTSKALLRGAELALAEATGRAGRYRVEIPDLPPNRRDWYNIAAWIGTSEALLYQGHQQTTPFYVSAIDTHPHTPNGCFRVTPGCDRQGQTAAAWTMKAGATRVALLVEKSSLRSQAIAQAFEASLPLVRPPFDAAVENVDAVLAAKPDLVFFSGEEAPYSTTFKIFSALRAKGFRGPLVTAEADPEVSFLATRPDLVEGSYLVTPFSPAPRELTVRMNATPGPHVTAGYLAMRAALRAIDRADSIDPAALIKAAAQLPEFDPSGASTRPCAIYIARNGIFEFVEELK
jgi:hypothetical protein